MTYCMTRYDSAVPARGRYRIARAPGSRIRPPAVAACDGRVAHQPGGYATPQPAGSIPFPADFAARLEGQRVRNVARRAKYLLVELASGDVLLAHLGMSGSFRVLRSARRRDHPAPHKGAPYHVDRLDAHDHVGSDRAPPPRRLALAVRRHYEPRALLVRES